MIKSVCGPLIALIVLGSGGLSGGCSGGRPSLPHPPLAISLPSCPVPARPRPPLIDGSLPFDAPANVNVLMERDDILRLYLQGLEEALKCWRIMESHD